MLLDLRKAESLVNRHRQQPPRSPGACPSQLAAAGSELAVTYLPDEKAVSRPRCASSPLRFEPSLVLPLNVQNPEPDRWRCSAKIERQWGHFDVLGIHWLAPPPPPPPPLFAAKEERSRLQPAIKP